MEATESNDTGTAGVALYPNVTPLVMRLKGTEKAHEFAGHVGLDDYNRYVERSNEWHPDGGEILSEDNSESEGIAIYDNIIQPVGYSGAVPPTHKAFVIGNYMRMRTTCVDNGTSFAVTISNCGRSVTLNMRRPTDAEYSESERILSMVARKVDKSYHKGRCKAFYKIGKNMLISASGYEDNAADKIPVHHLVEATIAVFKSDADELEIDLGN